MAIMLGTVTMPHAAPYVAFSAFSGFLRTLHKRHEGSVVPKVIDKEMMEGCNGVTSSHLFSALKVLGLIRDDGGITNEFESLVKAYGTEDWKVELGRLIERAYSPIIKDLHIETASSAQLRKKFKVNAGMSGTMGGRAVRFYVNALKEANVTFSPLFTKRQPRSVTPNGKGKGKATTKRKELLGLEKAAKAAEKKAQEEEEKTVAREGTQRYPLYFKDKAEGVLIVPEDLSLADCKVIELQLKVLRAYAGEDVE